MPTATVECYKNASLPTVDKATGTAGSVGDRYLDSLWKEELNFSYKLVKRKTSFFPILVHRPAEFCSQTPG